MKYVMPIPLKKYKWLSPLYWKLKKSMSLTYCVHPGLRLQLWAMLWCSNLSNSMVLDSFMVLYHRNSSYFIHLIPLQNGNWESYFHDAVEFNMFFMTIFSFRVLFREAVWDTEFSSDILKDFSQRWLSKLKWRHKLFFFLWIYVFLKRSEILYPNSNFFVTFNKLF